MLSMSTSKAYGAIRKDVPHRLRQIRQARGLSLEQLAARIGITWQTLQKYETEAQRLRVYQLQEIAEALDCTVIDIVAETGEASETERALHDRIRQLDPEEQARAIKVLEAMFGGANDRLAS